ncbi:hypothetical protein [Streptomyces sp. NPDC013187]|uniref:hypothetical protein n=1 Tax=Streptomyces sp. NPDC013187 TaxID=3364865 RepID=UPI003696F4FB
MWALVEPLLPPWSERSPRPRPVAGPARLQGVLYVLYNDIAWQLLPLELGFGSGLDLLAQAGAMGAERRRRARLVDGVCGRLPHPRGFCGLWPWLRRADSCRQLPPCVGPSGRAGCGGRPARRPPLGRVHRHRGGPGCGG